MIVREEALVIQNAICVEEIIPDEDWFKPAFSRNLSLKRWDDFAASENEVRENSHE